MQAKKVASLRSEASEAITLLDLTAEPETRPQPLEHVVDQCLSMRDHIAELEKPFLLRLTDMLLLELGRELAALKQIEDRKGMC
ncbi:hypothetical protein [Methylobacterium tarhaniae]|nr:hypothetical protein [Methylobacterium tarhaniae]